MKKILFALILAVAFAVHGQPSTNTPPSTPQEFYTSFWDYFTTNPTNLAPYTAFKAWTSGDYQNNINFADSINMSYDLLQPASYTKGLSLDLEAGMRNAGIAGTVVDGRGGIALAYNLYAIRVEGYADAGYEVPFHRTIGELGARIFKKATDNTFFGMYMGIQIPTVKGPTIPIFGLIVGADF